MRPAADTERAQIIIDGQAFWEMKDGDELEIETAKQFLQLIVSSTRDYFTILRNKLHWGVSGDKMPELPHFFF